MKGTDEHRDEAPDLTGPALVEWSRRWEHEWGYDSIPTVQSHYDDGDGMLRCVYPGCMFARRDAEAMWRHVHFGSKHRAARLKVRAWQKQARNP